MAGSNFKTFVDDVALFAAEMNDLQIHLVTTNDQAVGTPRSALYDFDGQILILDAGGSTTMRADTDNIITFKLKAADLILFDGSGTTPVNGWTTTLSATSVDVGLAATGSDADISLDLSPKAAGSIGIRGVETSFLMDQVFS